MEIIYPLFNRVIMLNLYKANDELKTLLEEKDIEFTDKYLKLPNGFMMVYMNVRLEAGIESGTFTFPVTFTENQTILLTTHQTNIIGATIRLYRKNSFPNVTVTSAQRIENIPDMYIYYIVIGRWK